jgi:osmotically-inducible protein OsmY
MRGKPHLDRLLGNLGWLAGIMAGSLRAFSEPVLLEPLATRVSREVGARNPAHTFVVDAASEAPPAAGDPTLLEEVLRQLAEGDSVAIRVADEGIGITPEQVATVFERFRRVGGERDHPLRGCASPSQLQHGCDPSVCGRVAFATPQMAEWQGRRWSGRRGNAAAPVPKPARDGQTRRRRARSLSDTAARSGPREGQPHTRRQSIMATMIRSDNDIQTDVIDEYVWDPAVDAPDVGVQAHDGVVTLTGAVDSYVIKLAAEKAAQRVDGVRAVANDLTVRTPLTHNDTDIAKAAANSLEANIALPADAMDVTVQNGKVTLRGEVTSYYQRVAAENAVQYLRGVRDVINLIQIKQPQVSATEVSAGIERALMRAAEVDADRIRVRTDDGHVALSGAVRSWPEKQEAGYAAWRAKGVTQVTNNIEVRAY